MILGGPLATTCSTCNAPIGRQCKASGLRGSHVARVRAAPPEQEARAGDLVLARVAGRGERTVLALLVEPGDTCTVRIWQPKRQTFARARLLPAMALVSLAPEDDARTKLAREELRSEHERTVIAPGMLGAVVVDGEKVADVASGTINGKPLGHSPSAPPDPPLAPTPDPWSDPHARRSDDPALKGW